jgi:hypothetical protein
MSFTNTNYLPYYYTDTSNLFTTSLGIGTNSTSYELDVVGDINFTGSLYQNGTQFVSGGGGEGGSIWISNNDNTIYYLSGNVGIGTTNHETTLHISSKDNTHLLIENSLTSEYCRTIIRNNNIYGEASLIIESKDNTDNTIVGWKIDNSSNTNNFSISYNSNYGDNYVDNWTNYLTIGKYGNIGIGTNNPSNTLTVIGDINFNGILYRNNLEFTYSWTKNGTNIYNPFGYVGIGTDNPSVPLEIFSYNGYINSSGISSIYALAVEYTQGTSGANSYTTAGTYSFTVPSGITSISVVAVGGGGGGSSSTTSASGISGGGGGGGALHHHTISVTPGEILTIGVGAGGLGGTAHKTNNAQAGGESYVKRGSTYLIRAGGGAKGVYNSTTTSAAGGLSYFSTLGGGGGNGGGGGRGLSNGASGGGGGAGGYSGNGGNGGRYNGASTATAGSGGGGGGGGTINSYTSKITRGGGGVGLLGQGANGAAGANSTANNAAAQGGAGSGGSGLTYGGGGTGAEDDSASGGANGGGGAVRISYTSQTSISLGNATNTITSGLENITNTTDIFTNKSIGTAEYVYSTLGTLGASDSRIKTNITDIDDGVALQTIRNLKPKKYNYIDTIKHGSEPVWGFIAQEVKDTLPYATQLKQDYIPNIYSLANVNSNVLTFTNFNTSNLEINNTKIKIITINGVNKYITLQTIIDEHSFSINETIDTNDMDTINNNIFVYGQYIDDFVLLKKEAIFTVATAALQELDRSIINSVQSLSEMEERIQLLEIALDKIKSTNNSNI